MKRGHTVDLVGALLSLGVAGLGLGCGDDAAGGSGGSGGGGSSSSAGGSDGVTSTGGDGGHGATGSSTASTTSSTGGSGTGGTGGTGGGEPLSPEAALEAAIDALCPGYAEVYCAAAATPCGCDDAPGFPDADACLESFEARCRRELSSYLEAAQAGQAAYHPEAAEACLDAMEPLIAACLLLPNDIFFVSCPILSPPGGFGPLPGEGEPCELPCAPGLRCGLDGLCQTPGQEGDACGFLPDCEPDLTCNLPPDGGDGTCAALDLADQGNACAGPEDCSGDTQCMASVRKVCVEPALGEVCHFDTDCQVTEYCLITAPDDPTPTGTCTPAPGLDEPCGNEVVCQAGLGCTVETTVCEALPQEGAPCAAGPEGPFLCAEGLGCVVKLCQPLPGLGESCASGHPSCEPGLGCAFEVDGSVCREPVGDGGACEHDGICQPGHFCNFAENLCRAFFDTGELCQAGNECGPSGACLPDATFTFRCAPAPGEGQACFLDECTGDLRCKTPYAAGACVPEVFCGALVF